MKVSENRGTPKSSQSLDHFSTKTYGDLGIPHFKKPLYVHLVCWFTH